MRRSRKVSHWAKFAGELTSRGTRAHRSHSDYMFLRCRCKSVH